MIAAHRRTQKPPAGLIHRAVIADLGRVRCGVGGQTGAWPSLTLANRADCRARAASTLARPENDTNPRASDDNTLKADLQVRFEANRDLLFLSQIYRALDPRDVQKSGSLWLMDQRFPWRLPAIAPHRA